MHDITVYLPLFNLLFGLVNTVTASLTFAEGYLLCSLVKFAMKTCYVGQGAVIAISQQVCNIKNAMKMHYVCQDSKHHVKYIQVGVQHFAHSNSPVGIA